MKPLLIVDGYNIIGAWELARQKNWSFDECRQRLVHRLEEYTAYHGWETIAVFDGVHSERLVRSLEPSGGVMVVYTRHGETADQYIERLCDEQPRHREIRVATSDSLEQTIVLGRGATRMPARELIKEMAETHAVQQAALTTAKVKKNPLIQHLPAHQMELLEKMRRGK